ncbi:MAG: leucine-rich repeat protein [Bacteroides cellulosilyticus]
MSVINCAVLTFLPPNWEEIPTSAFYSCDSLRAITFPSTVKTIGQQAFYYNLSLESLKMPAALTSIYTMLSTSVRRSEVSIYRPLHSLKSKVGSAM